jgi:hypothetical protein
VSYYPISLISESLTELLMTLDHLVVFLLLPVVGFPVVVDFSKSSGRTPLLPVVGLPEL